MSSNGMLVQRSPNKRKPSRDGDVEQAGALSLKSPVSTGIPKRVEEPLRLKIGNPAAVGLGGFALTTFVLQMHNLGLCGLGPVVSLGLVFGGGAQLVAGFLEMVTGNTFGFCAFTGYGSFWIALCIMLLFKRFDVYPMTDAEIGWFLVAFTVFTAVLWVGSLRLSRCHAMIFTSLLLGFVLLDLEKFVSPLFLAPAAWTLIFCAASALYGMAHVVLLDVYGRDMLPMGPALVR